MGYLYALKMSRGDGKPTIVPILPDDEKLAKQLANRYSAAARNVGDISYDVIYSEVDWQPYETDD